MHQQKIVVVRYGAEIIAGDQPTAVRLKNLGELLHTQIVISALEVDRDTVAQVAQDIVDLELEIHHRGQDGDDLRGSGVNVKPRPIILRDAVLNHCAGQSPEHRGVLLHRGYQVDGGVLDELEHIHVRIL